MLLEGRDCSFLDVVNSGGPEFGEEKGYQKGLPVNVEIIFTTTRIGKWVKGNSFLRLLFRKKAKGGEKWDKRKNFQKSIGS